jgi:hypothetical protein
MTSGDGAMAMFDWAARGRPIPGEFESGDTHIAAEFEGGALFGVVDGLGHGSEAATAARIAAALVGDQPNRSVLQLIQDCHAALRATRGAVLSLASIRAADGQLTWAGVGNVEAVVSRADPARRPGRERILLRSGVVGYQLPALRATDLPIFAGDVLIFASDGLRHDFAEDPPVALSPADQADHLLRIYGRDTDDATVLVARYRGPPA